MDNDIECIICQDELINSPFIKYQHTCGTYDIHQSCLDDWFIKNSHSCIICRNNIISSSESESNTNSSESESISSRELTDSSNLDTSYDADIESTNDHVYSNINLQDHLYESSYNTQNTNSKFICALLFFSIFLLVVILLFFI
jgi:hypothetical protein